MGLTFMKSSKPPRVPWYALCQAHTNSSPVSTPAPKMNTVVVKPDASLYCFSLVCMQFPG